MDILDAEARLALVELAARYAALVDARRVDAAGALFAEDAVFAMPDPPASLSPVRKREGREAIVRSLRRVLALDGTVHEIVGQSLEPVAEGIARGRTACVAHHLKDGLDEEWHLHYDDEYVRSGTGWLFARRLCTIDFLRRLPAVG